MWPKYTIFLYKPIQGKPFSEHNNPIKTKKNRNHMEKLPYMKFFHPFSWDRNYAVLEFNISDFFYNLGIIYNHKFSVMILKSLS